MGNVALETVQTVTTHVHTGRTRVRKFISRINIQRIYYFSNSLQLPGMYF